MRGIFITVLALVAASAAQFTGPCTDSNCGVSGENCEAEGRQCFPFPNVNPALREGCVCGSADIMPSLDQANTALSLSHGLQ
ncbi:hypothetical protein K4K57_007926 [Colletotrichum sp. SAR 10_99]|nr:hypothetical protein K4K55_007506 [Colletotrichum sp. SAR 10_96]KAJ5009996.1 hypothetical protein K4K57_007926 [Colletotrichum sp. SAR 10_99]